MVPIFLLPRGLQTYNWITVNLLVAPSFEREGYVEQSIKAPASGRTGNLAIRDVSMRGGLSDLMDPVEGLAACVADFFSSATHRS